MPGFLPLSPALKIFGHRGTLQVIRVTITNEYGRPVRSEAAPVPFEGVIHPASGRDVDRMPEGLRDRETLALFTDTKIDNGDEAAGTGPDIVVFTPAGEAPKRYLAYKCEDWSAASTAAHYRCILYREV